MNAANDNNRGKKGGNGVIGVGGFWWQHYYRGKRQKVAMQRKELKSNNSDHCTPYCRLSVQYYREYTSLGFSFKF